MEKLMRTGKYEYQSDFAKKYFARGEEKGREQGREEGREQGREEGREEGRAVGEARALLLVLSSRGIDVPPAAARRIDAERDDARFEAWIRRAVTATTIDDVFNDE
jgi:hypothetical protein